MVLQSNIQLWFYAVGEKSIRSARTPRVESVFQIWKHTSKAIKICHTWKPFSKSTPSQRLADCASKTTGTCFSIFAACEHQHVVEYKTRGMSALWNDCHWASYKAPKKSHKTFSQQPTCIVWQQYSANLDRRNEDRMKRRYEYSVNGIATEIRTWPKKCDGIVTCWYFV